MFNKQEFLYDSAVIIERALSNASAVREKVELEQAAIAAAE